MEPWSTVRNIPIQYDYYMFYLITWLTDCALFLFVFSGTRLLAETDASMTTQGVAGAVFFLASGISNFCSGLLADTFDRRATALWGMGCFLVSLASVAVFRPVGVDYIVAYIVVGLSVGQVYPPIMAWMWSEKSERAVDLSYVYFCIAFNCGILSGQVSGGWLFLSIGPRSPVLFASGLILVAWIILWTIRNSPKKTVSISDSDKGFVCLDILAPVFTRLTWLANFAGMFSMGTLWFLLPELVVALEIPSNTHGQVLAAGRCLVVVTYVMMYLFPVWNYQYRYFVLTQAFGLAGLIGITQAQSPLQLFVSIAGLSIMQGFNYYSSLYYSRKSASADSTATAYGLNEGVLALGAAGGSLFGGLSGTAWGSRTPFYIATVTMLLVAAIQCVYFCIRIRPAFKKGISQASTNQRCDDS
jgi:MFS family permease